jgi:amino acid adenylation domain-containing protein
MPEYFPLLNKWRSPQGEIMETCSMETAVREDLDIEQSVVTCFEAQVARYRDRLAVRDAKQSFSYGELNALANGVALAIHRNGEREPGAVVLLLGQGALIPVAVLGVLKAARFYVSLDPGHPHERNAFILADSGARVILTDRSNHDAATALAAGSEASPAVLVIEELEAAGNRPDLEISPHDMCCIVYTSGSTGTPKGVCQSHRNIAHTAMMCRRLAGIGFEDRFSFLQLMNVNAGGNALFGALLNGAALFPFRVQQGVERLAEYIDEERITCLHTVPTLFRHLANYISDVSPGRRFMHVRLLRLGGESITGTDWLHYTTLFAESCKLFAGLGSAEGQDLRRKLYRRDEPLVDAVLPLGDPVPGVEILLLDESGVPVKNGEVGRIVVRSDHLFPGYWRRDDLTRQVLQPDPQDPARKLFHTGDLGRYSPDGRLFHAGRADFQVKIGGNRVEISGIESILRQIPLVRDAAVVMLERAGNTPHLVAYVAVTRSWAAPMPTPQSMSAQLRAALPENHVPSAFVILDELPLLPGGKIDRKTLQARAAALRTDYVGPRNEVEETLVEMLQQILGVPRIGVHDNFFLHYGCDSLAAVQILLGVSRLFQRELPLSSLYEASTVATLSQRILDVGWSPPASGLLSMHSTGEKLPLFAVCGVFGYALRLLLVGNALGEEQPFHALQPPDMDWSRVGCATIEEMAAYYVPEIQRIQPHGPYQLLGTSFGGVMMFEIALQLQRMGEEVSLLAMVDTITPSCYGPDWSDQRAARSPISGDETAGIVGKGYRVARVQREANNRYSLHYSRIFNGQITYFRCEQPPIPAATDRRLLWGRFATGGMRIFPVPGYHGKFHCEPQFSAVVKGLRTSLESVH